jgi:hypothetical protein
MAATTALQPIHLRLYHCVFIARYLLAAFGLTLLVDSLVCCASICRGYLLQTFLKTLDLLLQAIILLLQAVVVLLRLDHVQGELFDLAEELRLHLTDVQPLFLDLGCRRDVGQVMVFFDELFHLGKRLKVITGSKT